MQKNINFAIRFFDILNSDDLVTLNLEQYTCFQHTEIYRQYRIRVYFFWNGHTGLNTNWNKIRSRSFRLRFASDGQAALNY